MPDKYYVWSNERSAWWGPNNSGYTQNKDTAGQYDRDEAIRICAFSRDGIGSGLLPTEIPVNVTDIAEAHELYTAATQ